MTSASEPLSSPPRAPVAFRVGIVGHRPNRLPKDEATWDGIAETLHMILAEVKRQVEAFAAEPNFYSTERSRLFGVSPLAEGSDRMFADAAMTLGYRLCVPMPFEKAEYKKDFEKRPGSEAEFERLLTRSPDTIRFELDGRREDEDPYGAAGRIVVNQSDLLIAVWDGKPSEGKGGTVDTIGEALRYHVPIVWVDAEAPFGWRRLYHVKGAEADRPTVLPADSLRETIAKIVATELAMPPAAAPDKTEEAAKQSHDHSEHLSPTDLASAYLAERRPPRNFHFLWKSVRNLLGGIEMDKVLPVWHTQDYVAEEKQRSADDGLLAHFAWADRLADLYADRHRSGVIGTSALSALVVAVGLGGFKEYPAAEALLILLEFGLLIWLSRVLHHTRKLRYHEKWLDYRLLAEWIRQLRILAPLGGYRPLLRSHAHLQVYGEPTKSWMYWHVRAITRAHPLPAVFDDETYLARRLDALGAVIDDQRGFHDLTRRRSARIQDRLIFAVRVIVAITMIAVIAHFTFTLIELSVDGLESRVTLLKDLHVPYYWVVAGLLLLCSAFLPALSASIVNVNNQGEFTRLGKRARAMRDGFARLGAEATALRARIDAADEPATLHDVSTLAARVASTMLEEVIDWRVVVLDLPQGLE